MSSDEDFILEDEESRNNKSPTSNQANKDGEDGENKGNAATQISLPQKRKAEEADIVEGSKQSVASPAVQEEDDSCSIAIQTAPPRLKKKRKNHAPATDVKPGEVFKTVASTVPQGGAAVTPPTSITKIPQGNRPNILHIPAGLHSVAAKKVANVTVDTSATVNTNNTVSVSGLSIKTVLPSAGITQPEKKANTVRILSKAPATLNPSASSTVGASTSSTVGASASSTVAVQPSSSLGVPSRPVHSVSSNQAVMASKSLSSTAVPVAAQHVQPQARLSAAVPAGVGKVVLVSSSGVPLQVLKTMSVAQPLIQGKAMNPAVLATQGSTVVSTSSLSNPVGVATLASSSLTTKSISSQLPSSAVPKVAIPVTPSKLSSVLSTSPVFLVQRPGSGGVVPLAVKGGAIVVPASSAPQQVVVIRPSSSVTSSTTSATTQLSGAGIAVLGNTAQIAQTALGHKVVLSASTTLPPKTKTVTVDKPVVDQAAKTPLEVKPSELKTSSLALGNTPIMLKTTSSSTASETSRSNSTVLVTRAPDPKPTCATLVADSEQAWLGTVASSDATVVDKDSVNMGSNRVCGTEISDTVMKALVSNCETLKGTDSPTVITVSPEKDRKQTKVTCEDQSLASLTIKAKKSSQPEVTADDNVEGKASIEVHDKDKDAENGSDPLVDLTCYETSVSDSTCGESDDSAAPNGLHADIKTTLPCKLAEMDVKLCNGVSRSVTPDTKCVEQELDSGERIHAVTDQATNGVLMNET